MNQQEDRKAPQVSELVAVETLLVGDQVDLKSCPFLKDQASAEFEYAVVESIERETHDCITVEYEGIDGVGYPVGTMLKVSPGTVVSRESIDWYERRHELKPEMVFKTVFGGIVKLDRRVPGDGTQWYVADRCDSSWHYQDAIIEPSDLVGCQLSERNLDQGK